MGKKIDVNNLSPEAREVVNLKRATGGHKLKDWFQLLGEAAVFDEAADALRAKYRKRAIIFLILTILFGFIAIPTVGITLVVAVPSLIATIIYYVKMKGLKKTDLDNEFREVLIPFLETISEDVRAQGRIKLDLDLSGPTKAKVVRSEQVPPGRFKKVVQTVYEDPWCKVEVPLVDGTRLLLQIENTYITHDRYWRNARGKSKHKTKWRKTVRATAGMMPDDRFDFDKHDLDELAGREKVKAMDKAGREAVRLSRKFTFKEVNAPPAGHIGPEELMSMFFQLGSMLRPAGAVGGGGS